MDVADHCLTQASTTNTKRTSFRRLLALRYAYIFNETSMNLIFSLFLSLCLALRELIIHS